MLLIRFHDMSSARTLLGLVVLGLLGRPALAAADEVYSYQDDDGVLHCSNAPTDSRCHKVNRSGGTLDV